MRSTHGPAAGALYRLEALAAGDTLLHRLHPGVKLLGTLCYLLCILSLPVHNLGQLLSFILIPVVGITLGEIPPGMILRRTLLALPFCLFAGAANVILDRQVLFMLGRLPVTAGLLSCGSILLRTLLCVSSVLLLVALTPFQELTALLRRLRVPAFLVALLEMTYRYVGTLINEAGTMSEAYHLRAGNVRGLEMRHMGSFVGMLLLRSYDRAERVYQAMECRGYGGVWGAVPGRRLAGRDLAGLVLLCGGPILLRLVDIPELLGRWLICWM